MAAAGTGDSPAAAVPGGWTKVGSFPAEAFRVSAGTAYDVATSVFGCHETGVDRPMVCAGYLRRGAAHSLTVRLWAATGPARPAPGRRR